MQREEIECWESNSLYTIERRQRGQRREWYRVSEREVEALGSTKTPVGLCWPEGQPAWRADRNPFCSIPSASSNTPHSTNTLNLRNTGLVPLSPIPPRSAQIKMPPRCTFKLGRGHQGRQGKMSTPNVCKLSECCRMALCTSADLPGWYPLQQAMIKDPQWWHWISDQYLKACPEGVITGRE